MTSNTEPLSANGAAGSVVPPWLGASTRFRRIEHVPETGSTNADLLARAGRGGSFPGEGPVSAGAVTLPLVPQVLYTDHQKTGRGRQDRHWYDHPGDSLLVSVLIEVGTEVASLVPLAVGLAALGAASEHLPTDKDEPLLALKWPNDLLAPAFGQRKLAGVLVESVTTGAPSPTLAVVMGMGMNLRRTETPPPDVAKLAVTLHEMTAGGPDTVPSPDRDRLLDRYLVHLDRRLDQLQSRRSLLVDYGAACLTLGRQVRFQSGSEVISGVAVDIGSDGELIVDADNGDRRSLRAGDVHHLE